MLGAALLEQSVLSDIAEFVVPEIFYNKAHGQIWKAIMDLHKARDPVDILTVTRRLTLNGVIESAGGAFYISQLTNRVASSHNVHYHARLLVQFHVQRQAIRIGADLQRDGYNTTVDAFDVIAKAGASIRLLNEFGSGDERTMSEIMPSVVDEDYKDRGVHTGFADIDKQFRFEPGTMTIIGARPGMGKTSFMLSSAKRQAWMGHRPYIAELEMRDRNLATRLICGEVGVPIWKVKRNLLSPRDKEQMAAWHVKHGAELDRMLINEQSTMTTTSLAARLDRAKRKHRCDMVWIDYIGLMQPSEKQKDAYHRMTKISNELRVLAKDLDLPFAVLAQLSRPPKGTAVRPPTLPDLRDSGEIEQDAEAVLFLHRPKYYDSSANDDVEVVIAKYRDGEDGKVELTFDGPGVRMVDKSHYDTSPLGQFTTVAEPMRDDEPF